MTTVSTAPIAVGPHRFTVPQNRWGLVPPPRTPPTVSVVVPYYRQQDQLDRLFAGIAAQTGFVDVVEVIVADDGSPEPPTVESSPGLPEVVVVRQDDRGRRPGAARNLGVAAARGEVVAFLDADMVPGPDYLAAVAALPAVAPEALVVGTRRHVDLSGWSPEAVRRWLAGGPAPARLDDPTWLADGYCASRDLVDLDDRSWQWVIGAVMTMSRAMFDEVGGFDATIDHYGAEDWDLAHRVQQAGGILAHVDAVAWHDGPDWAGREGPGATKNPERLALVDRIAALDDPIVGPVPAVVARVDATGWDVDTAVAVTASWLQAGGTGIRVVMDGAPEGLWHVCRHDARVLSGPAHNMRSGLVDIDVHAPVRAGADSVAAILALVRPGGPGRVSVVADDSVIVSATSVRCAARVRRWTGAGDDERWWRTLFGPTRRVTAGTVDVSLMRDHVDLATVFPR